MRNVLLVLEYDGTEFHGFQWQPGLRTIQAELERALHQITGEQIRVVGAGRTDAGVHAAGQAVSFRTTSRLATARLVGALNAVLPRDVVVRSGREVPLEFHARYSAWGRAYRYSIWNAGTPTALRRLYTYHWPGHLDVDAMRLAARSLVGTHDFASFAGSADGVGRGTGRTTLRTVYWADCRREGNLVEIDVAANAFLPHMIRNLVGTLLWVGGGRIDQEDFAAILASRDRTVAGPAAPARGLCLAEVYYEWPSIEESAMAQRTGIARAVRQPGGVRADG